MISILTSPVCSTITGWWFGCHVLFSHILGCCHHPNWRTIFFRGVALAHQPENVTSRWCFGGPCHVYEAAGCHGRILVGGLVAMNFMFPYIGNNHPNWLSYFSEGFKPPTRISLLKPKRKVLFKTWFGRSKGISFRSNDHGFPDLSEISPARHVRLDGRTMICIWLSNRWPLFTTKLELFVEWNTSVHPWVSMILTHTHLRDVSMLGIVSLKKSDWCRHYRSQHVSSGWMNLVDGWWNGECWSTRMWTWRQRRTWWRGSSKGGFLIQAKWSPVRVLYSRFVGHNFRGAPPWNLEKYV